ncbi:hypothetical protein [Methylobacterium sp. WCS2018Hpa-22]|uniref:hypothetical protein n=1 Tax=Methylobacterium sp. WCS2018Hpa-22 TaxID=3073633 RepID=UPI00288BA614|nr:hypothetical protein [Methylobacterium sp. WCS2018Hpa-22]
MSHENVSPEEIAFLRLATGLEWKRTAYKNFGACNLKRPTYPFALKLVARGFMVEDPSAHFGRMRVFRVTKEGFAFMGVPRPKRALLDLVPEPAPVSEPLDLAA